MARTGINISIIFNVAAQQEILMPLSPLTEKVYDSDVTRF